MTEVIAALGDMLQIAHETQIPHQEPPRGAEEDGRPTCLQSIGALHQAVARRQRPRDEEGDDCDRLRRQVDPEEEREPRRHPRPAAA